MKLPAALSNLFKGAPKEPLALEEASKKDAELVKYWLDQVAQYQKRSKDFHKLGREAVSIYEADDTGVDGRATTPFNILYSNTETMAPALYNSVPRPIVKRRFDDEDPLGALSAKACERALAYLANTNDDAYPSYDDIMRAAVQEALVPGWGVSWVKYDATISEKPVESVDELVEGDDDTDDETDEPDADDAVPPSTVEDVSYETVCFEEVPWDRFMLGYGKKWKQVPWVGRRHYFTRQECIDNFGEAVGKSIKLTATSKESDQGKMDSDVPSQPSGNGEVTLAVVDELWDKRTRKVYFISEGLKDRPCKVSDDPLGLTGFFPCPKPLTFVVKMSSMQPVSLYAFYRSQAQELNNLTTRAKRLISAIKFRGGYDASIQDIDKILEGDENALVPLDGVQALGMQGSLERAIWTVPVDTIVQTLREVMAQRESVKTVIYEITGMSDIIRGVSKASETLGAQQIKSQWGGLRIRRLQAEVMRYSRDLFRLAAEVSINKLEETTWKGMTGLPYPTGSEQAQAQALAQQAQSLGQQPPPDVTQALGQPSWTQVLALLRNDTQRQYRIDIETNSTVDAEATEDKQAVGEVLNAIAQFMSGVSPLIESGVMPFQVAQQILLAVVRRYRFGTEIENALKMMQPPNPPQPDPGQKQQNDLELQKAQLELQGKKMEFDSKSQLNQQQMELASQQHAANMAESKQKMIESQVMHDMKLKQLAFKAATAAPVPHTEVS